MTAITAGRRTPAHAQVLAGQSARRHRYLFWSLLAVAATLYLTGLTRNGWANDFYAAAVQAGSTSWKAFFFGSFDASNFITVDKTPASLWVMELSVRLFGLNYWSMLVPQALEGVASVAVLYAAVRRWYGPWAGLLAGAVLAVTPVAALMFRYNNPDSLLVLLMAVGAYAMVRAVESGRTGWLVLAGTTIGFGFLTKMLQAFLVLPAFGLVYLVAGPRRLPARLLQLLAGLGAVVVSAGWWVAAVMLTPAASRPYVGGSTNDSILELALGYNGLGRLTGNETGSVGFTANRGGSPAFSGAAGLGRLFGSDMGGQISWLLPAALIAIGALLWLAWASSRGRLAVLGASQGGQAAQSGHPARRDLASVLLWGGWLLVTGGVFSFMAGIIHPYYTIALAPAIGALVGIGAVRLWQSAASWQARCWLAIGVASTAVWSFVLLDLSPTWLPLLRYAVLLTGLASAAALLAAPQLGALAGSALRRRAVAALVAGTAAFAALAGPVAYSIDTAASSHAGALPTAGPAVAAAFGRGGAGGPGGAGFGRGFGARAGLPGAGSRPGGSGLGQPPGGGTRSGLGRPSGLGAGRGRGSGGGGGLGSGGTGLRGGPGGGLSGATTVSTALTRLLEQDAVAYRWAAATVGSESAAPLQLATRQPVMSIGGFNGTDPSPTLAEFEHLVAEHEVHYFVGANASSFGGGSGDAQAITKWVTSHFRSETVAGETVYNLTEPRA